MNQTLTEKESAIKFLKEHYRDLLDKHRKYMNGEYENVGEVGFGALFQVYEYFKNEYGYEV